MDTKNGIREAQAHPLAEEARHEPGDALPDEHDDYAEQCDYAGCYPWLADVIRAQPHDSAALNALQGDDAAGEDDLPYWAV